MGARKAVADATPRGFLCGTRKDAFPPDEILGHSSGYIWIKLQKFLVISSFYDYCRKCLSSQFYKILHLENSSLLENDDKLTHHNSKLMFLK